MQTAHAQDHDQDDRRRPAHRRARRADAASGARRTPASSSIASTCRLRSAIPGRRAATSATRGCRRRCPRTARSVSTVEHLMSALAGLGIDNLHVDVAGPEIADHGRQRRSVRVPAAVGGHRRAGRAEALSAHHDAGRSARRRQVGALRAVSTASSSTSRSIFRIRCSARRTGTSSSISPSIRTCKEVARARTFGFMQDVEAMRAAGLGARRQPAERDRARRIPRAEQRGPALRQRVRQAQGARRDRRSVSARPSADRRSTRRSSPGHALNNALSRALLARPDAFEIVTFDAPSRRAARVPGLAAAAGLTLGAAAAARRGASRR